MPAVRPRPTSARSRGRCGATASRWPWAARARSSTSPRWSRAPRGGEPGRTAEQLRVHREELAEVVDSPGRQAPHRQGAGQGRRASTPSGPTSSSAAPSCSSRRSPSCGIERDDRLRLRPARGRAARRAPAHAATRRSTTSRDLRYQSVRHLADICPDEREHAEHADRAGPAAVRRHRRPAPARRRVPRDTSRRRRCCANVGLFISHARHHLHSYYIIRNSEQLPGSPTTRSSSSPRSPATTARARPRPSHEEFAALAARRPGGGAQAGRHPARRHRPRPHARPARHWSVRCAARGRPRHPLNVRGDASLEEYTADERKASCSRTPSASRSGSTRSGVIRGRGDASPVPWCPYTDSEERS